MDLLLHTHRRIVGMLCVVAFLAVMPPRHLLGQPCELLTILPDDPSADARFGRSVAIDGPYMAIGAHRQDLESGSVSVFEQVPGQPGQWTLVATLTDPNPRPGDAFGIDVDLSGSTLIVGAYLDDTGALNAGSASIFERAESGEWTHVAKLVAPDRTAEDEFGYSVAIDGAIAIIGARNDNAGTPRSGSAYVFERVGQAWTPSAKLVATDQATFDWFGSVVDVRGDVAAIGAWRDDDHGDDSGSVYLFTRDAPGVWTPLQKLTAIDGGPDDRFGIDLDLHDDWLIVGATGKNLAVTDAGAAYLFQREPGVQPTFQPIARLAASDAVALDFLGVAVAVNDAVAAVASYHGNATGNVYVYDLVRGSGATRTEDAIIGASTGQPNDRFGRSVDLDQDHILVGTYRDDDRGPDTGAAFLFAIEPAFALNALVPALAGEVNVLRAVCATPLRDVSFVYGLLDGSQAAPICGGVVFDMQRPQLAATVQADANGHAWLQARLPVSSRGAAIRLQALDHATCTVAPVSVEQIR